MADKSRIEWTDATWNPVMGCSRVSEGCQRCYALRMIRRYAGRLGWPDAPNEVTLFPERLDEPLRWRQPRRVFVCSMADLFHPDVPTSFIDRVLQVIEACPLHTFIILTKRPENLEAKLYGVTDDNPCRELASGDYLPNLWLGVSVENQARADERIPLLLRVPAAVHWVSIEPMLGPVDLTGMLGDGKLSWCVVGGETGPGARPMHPDWVRSVRDQCCATGTAFFFKSWGEWAEVNGPRCRAVNLTAAATGFWIEPDGKVVARDARSNRCHSTYGTPVMARIGKRRAGYLLDGQEWRQYPRLLPRVGGGLEEPPEEEESND